MFLINPYAFSVAGGDFESIATVTVGSGGSATVEFTSIAATYQHLQIRGVARSTFNSTGSALWIRLNGDTGANYSAHGLYGDGSSAAAFGAANTTNSGSIYLSGNTASASAFGGIVIDILDYATTTKNKTVRLLSGAETNSDGQLRLASGSLRSTSAITSVTLLDANGGNFAQHSTFALYGVKAP